MLHTVRNICLATGAMLAVSGCASFDLSRYAVDKNTSITAATCDAAVKLVAVEEKTLTGGTAKMFHFVLPASVANHPNNTLTLGHAARKQSAPTDFDRFKEQMETTVGERLPPELRNDAFVRAIKMHFIKVSAQAQLNAAHKGGAPINAQQVQAGIDDYSPPDTIAHDDLKTFATTFSTKLLKPKFSNSGEQSTSGANMSTFIAYLKACYHGKFVDRFGQAVAKPELSTKLPLAVTVTDADIAAAETVLLEYLIDVFDPTPVLGNSKDKPTADALDKTSFFPGGKPENRPTAYDVDMANYAYIPEKGCGVTQESLSDLTTLAGAAGDMAATVDGLTLNSFGGVHYGLGVMGKFSIGDNQTLTVLVKTALSRLSKRITYASGYWLLHGLGEPGSPRASSLKSES